MKKILSTGFLLLFGFFLTATQVQAAGLVPCGEPGNECGFCDIFVLINNVVKFFLFPPPAGAGIVPLIATLMLVIGGVMLFFAGANPGMLLKAKGIIWSVVIGLLIIFCAWVAVNTILSNLGIVEGSSLLRWYDIGCK